MIFSEQELREEFERMHEGRCLMRHHLRGTYLKVNIAALWNQHKKTAQWMSMTNNEKIDLTQKIKDEILKIPTRIEQLGGQNYKYVRLEEVLHTINDFDQERDNS